ncbi:DNA-binding response regulator [Arenicella chitinivorans]|uniref:DNA-binding response regulator n=1 Tax=Arenicella chitinivorans TaxID=1329800 RepID=A0A918RUU7_9GAMM|nr:response regulator transcription factor [Arenicella chitinivorans]GHA12021.1 DNA-binding response regulator [Arenicella chitinivorans]
MKLLICEDDQLIRDGLYDILSAEGYSCSMAEDGNVALTQYAAMQPDIVLLDIMMPGRDGYAVCREIRAQNAQVAILFISAKSEEIDQVLGLELGADDYIMKPFGKHEVVARVRAVARRYRLATSTDQGQAQLPSFTMGDLRVNMQELRATRGDQTIDLSVRDCKILHLLHRRVNQVVTREELFNQAWGRTYLPNSRTLDQHISSLRKRVELDPSAPCLITTVHGVGYRYDSA